MVVTSLPGRRRLCGLAVNPALPVDLVDRLIATGDTEVCLYLADRDDLSASRLRLLAARGGTDTAVALVRRGLATAADVDPADARVALALLEVGGAPGSWALALAGHPDPSVRAGVAAAGHVPVDVLRDLVDDPDVVVVAEAARSPTMPADLVMRLAGHPHVGVRRGVAGNEATPASLLAALGTDGALPPARWCYGCDGRADPPPGMCCRGGHEGAWVDLRYALAVNPATPPQTVAGWVDHPAMWVRWAVAERQDLPPEVHRRLAGDPVPGVRGEVAANPTSGESLIRTMAGDDTYDVRRRLAHNPRVPLDVLAAIAPVTRIGPTLLPRIAAADTAEVAQLARSPVAAVRMLLAARPDLPPDVVNLLADDPDAKVLKSLAPNPTLTEAQLRTMVARHGSRVVVRPCQRGRSSSCSTIPTSGWPKRRRRTLPCHAPRCGPSSRSGG
ncbi:hypothetical protein GCM10009557_09830 [Virgisporangium ochraceum]